MKLVDIDMGIFESMDDAREINSMCNGLSHLLMYLLGKVDNERFRKLVVSLALDEKQISLECLQNIAVVKVPFSFDLYTKITSDKEKLRFLATTMIKGVSFFVEKASLKPRDFKDALDSLEKDSLNLVFCYGSEKWNKTKTSSATLFYSFKKDKVVIGAEIKGEVEKELIFTETLTDWMFIEPLLGSMKWIDEKSLELKSKDKTEVFKVFL